MSSSDSAAQSKETASKSQPGPHYQFISQAGLKKLSEYKYVSGSYSFMDNLMTPFWNWFVTLIPMTVAPNMITLIGLLACLVGNAIMLIHDTSLTAVMPLWAYLAGVLGIFLYQTFDAVDGKQARRTGTSSPLGQLFDHGCDALVVTLASLIFYQAMMMGQEPDLMALFFMYTSAHLTFYLGQWEEQHTHILRSNLWGILGVTEIQWAQIIFMLINAFSGQWLTKTTCGELVPELVELVPFVAQRNLTWAIAFGCFSGGIVQALMSIVTVLRKLGLADFFNEAFTGLIPIIQWGGAVAITFSSSQWAWQNPSLALLILMPGYGLINSKMIVCNVTNMEVEVNPSAFVTFISFFANATQFHYDEWKVALFIFLFETIQYFLFVTCTIRQITTYLDINCLTIKHAKGGSNRVADSSASSTQASPSESAEQKKPENRAQRRKAAKDAQIKAAQEAKAKAKAEANAKKGSAVSRPSVKSKSQ